MICEKEVEINRLRYEEEAKLKLKNIDQYPNTYKNATTKLHIQDYEENEAVSFAIIRLFLFSHLLNWIGMLQAEFIAQVNSLIRIIYPRTKK